MARGNWRGERKLFRECLALNEIIKSWNRIVIR
jgi:hypothetical protein